MPEPVEAEVGDDERAAVARLFVGESGGEKRRQPDRAEAVLRVCAACLGCEDDARSTRTHKQLLAEQLDFEAREWNGLRPAALVQAARDETAPASRSTRSSVSVTAMVKRRPPVPQNVNGCSCG